MGLDGSPAVMKDNSVPPDRRSRCWVAGRMWGFSPRLITRNVYAEAIATAARGAHRCRVCDRGTSGASGKAASPVARTRWSQVKASISLRTT